MTKPDVIIDLQTVYPSDGLLARKIWEALFRLADAGKFKSYDSFLCDLKLFERLLNDQTNLFWWRYDVNGFTDTTTYRTSESFEIQVANRQITITKVE